MDQDLREALGEVVRELRESKGLTQEELGRAAGYRTGAGVSISRLENGLLSPRPERLDALAKALGLAVDGLQELARRRAANRQSHADSSPGSGDSSHERASSAGSPPSQRELNERRSLIEREVEGRTKAITELSEAFNTQHDRARDEFFMRFIAIATRVEGAPQPDQAQLDGNEPSDPGSFATHQLASNANGFTRALAAGTGGAAAGVAVGGAAAYGTFVAAAAFGSASTGAAISGLSGIAATNATLALLGGGTIAAGGAGIAGGTLLLAGIVAAPAAILFAGGLAWMVRRNRKQRQEFAEQLDEAEAQLVATEPGVAALKSILPQATETLDYIATHAGHALLRWQEQLAAGPLEWDSLGEPEQLRYVDFTEIAAAQLTIVTFNYEGVLIARDSDRDTLIELADTVLAQSRAAVTSHV